MERALTKDGMVIAADSGASGALELGCEPTYVVGDLDSLSPQTRARLERSGCTIVRAPAEKDETDTELAIEKALDLGATSITLLGALGGTRFEHTIANILLLAAYTLPLEIVDGNSRGWLLRGPGETLIQGKQGDLLSLFPLMAAAEGVYTENLYYPLRGETLRFGRPRGLSNVLQDRQAKVALEIGLLLVIHTEI